MQIKFDKKRRFISVFNPNTGYYMRTGMLEDEGVKEINKETSGIELLTIMHAYDTGVDPFMASYPELLDVGIMGHCNHGASGLCIKSGVQCYQNGLKTKRPNMPFEDFKKIVDQSKGKTFQFALGGRGDADQHEDFEKILRYCRDNGIVPNFTSSGLGFNEKIVTLCKELCGAVAISWYRQEHTNKAIRMLLDAGVTTNIHYVLGNNSIDEAIEMLENNSFPDGINAVIFLLHKPVGLGQETNVLKADDERVKKFFKLIDERKFPFQIGFDSCSCAGIVNNTKRIDMTSIDFCEGGRFSAYIDADMNMMPCSFANQDPSWFVNLKDHSIQEAWNSEVFDRFRYSLWNSCKGCKDRNCCGGGCPLVNQITLCNRRERDFKNYINEVKYA